MGLVAATNGRAARPLALLRAPLVRLSALAARVPVGVGPHRRELDAEHIDNPTWSHDSRYIYYDADGAEANVGVFRVRINDGKVNLAAPYKWMRIADHTWSGLAPDDSPIVLRAMGSPEIYSLDVKWP